MQFIFMLHICAIEQTMWDSRHDQNINNVIYMPHISHIYFQRRKQL